MEICPVVEFDVVPSKKKGGNVYMYEYSFYAIKPQLFKINY
jgi:hypothetical protein